MSTLHQYRWKSLPHCRQRLHFIDAQDAVLIYGEWTTQDQHTLLNELPQLAGRCHWLNNELSGISGINTINYQQWLTLIAEHDKTHTWK